MAGLISRQFIDDLLAKTDIVELINRRVKLKKAGRDYHACCPFHREKTPSFTVSARKQFYHCFGCHAHGNAISFLMDYDKLDFVEAVEELAAFHGLEVSYEKSERGNERTKAGYQRKRHLYGLMAQIAVFYQEQLLQSALSRRYLQERGLSDEVISRYQIGFSPNSFDSVLRAFGNSSEDRKMLSDLGMLSVKDQRIYDRFRHRIMFPIRDRRGQTVGFGGRVLGDEKPKYLNSPETVIYHKGNVLYGLFEALQMNESPSKLLIVEGYMDVVALAQFDICYAVASLGTATTPEQIQLAFRVTDQIICCYDGDRAGKEAAWRALENALPYLEDGLNLKFIFLPDGEDPDTFVRRYGKEAFEQKIAEALPLNEFLFSTLSEEVDFSSKESKVKLAALALPLIKKIPGEVLRLSLQNTLGQKLGMFSQEQVIALIKNEEEDPVSRATPTSMKPTPMRLLIALLLQNPTLVSYVPELTSLRSLNEPGFDLFEKLTALCRDRIGITTGQILEHWRGNDEANILAKLAMWDHMIDQANIESAFCETLHHFYRRVIEHRINVLLAKKRTHGLTEQETLEISTLFTAKKSIVNQIKK